MIAEIIKWSVEETLIPKNNFHSTDGYAALQFCLADKNVTL